MKRRVLLLEPNYRNKYPPMGLMKLAMYHRLQGDDVVFYKGDLSAFVLAELVRDAIAKFQELDREREHEINWNVLTPSIAEFIKTGKIEPQSPIEQALKKQPLAKPWLDSFRKQFRTGGYFEKRRWDRVCVTTLFTFYWDITIETIEFAKRIGKKVMVGGILASVVPAAVERATGIKPYVGCLNITKLPGDKSLPPPYENTLIDELPLDYSILEEIDYRYPATDAYFAYATRGCVNKCAFCAVPILEPEYKDYIPLKKRLQETETRFGAQRHLLLLDNNVFASKKFDEIIDEIHDSGFERGASFIPTNPLEVAIRQLRDSWNDRAYVRQSVRLLNEYAEKLEDEKHDHIYGLLLNHGLLHDYTAIKENIFAVYEKMKEDYAKSLHRRPVVRFVDFNQGMDARLATPKKMEKLATVNIRPLRIAFDSWADRKHYVHAVKLAQENGITQMSNYLLYNFMDAPVDLYRRLLLNIDLCDELDVNIYSFPMKYHPIMDEKWFSNRDYIGSKWTRKAIRTVQAVLNSTRGKIGRGRTFFFKAFGRTEKEFEEIIRMPEAFIIKRWDAELSGLTKRWHDAYSALSDEDRSFVDEIVDQNDFTCSTWEKGSSEMRRVFDFYLLERESITLADKGEKERAIGAFEKTCAQEISRECRQLLAIEFAQTQ